MTKRTPLQAMMNLAAKVNASLRIDDVLEYAMGCAEEMIHAETSTIFEIDQTQGDLYVRIARGEKGKALSGLRLRPGEGIAGWVAMTGQSLLLTHPREDPRFCPRFDHALGFITRSIAAVPLRVQRNVIGVLEVLNRKNGTPFSRHDLRLLEALGCQVAVAMDNARMHSRLRKNFEITREELKAAQEQLLRRERQEALASLAVAMAHEVRNPTTVIGGGLNIAMRYVPQDHPFHDWITRMRGEVSRLEKLVERVQDFASLPEPTVAMADLAEVIYEVVERLRRRAQDLSVELVVAHRDGPLPLFPFDRALVAKALGEIAANALDVSVPGGKVRIVIGRDGLGRAVISIIDQGPGLSEEAHARALEPFFSTDSRKIGLGLSMANRILMDHRGAMEIVSNGGVGTQVNILLPIELGELA